jgi:hypothetical protein
LAAVPGFRSEEGSAMMAGDETGAVAGGCCAGCVGGCVWANAIKLALASISQIDIRALLRVICIP